MKATSFAVLIAFTFVAACAPAATPTLAPTITPVVGTIPTSASVPTLTATPRLQATVKQDAILYAGPGNDGYNALAQLKAGTAVYPLGTYVDFVKLEADTSGKTVQGFVSKESLGTLPPSLKELAITDIPWQPVFILNNFVSPNTIFQGNDIILKNDSDGFYDVAGIPPIPIYMPFMLTVKLQVSKATYGAFKTYGIYSSPDKLWWQEIRSMIVALSNNSIQIGFRDGTSENVKNTINLPINASQSFSLVLNDVQGKVITVLDQNQREVRKIDVTTMAGLQMEDGSLPERKLYLGATSSPHSSLTLTSPAMRQAPTGKMTKTEKNIGLRELAKQKGISIGTEFSMYQMRDKRYWDIMANDFDTIVVAGFSCRKDVWLGRKEYNFEPVDRSVNFALQQGWRVRVASLVWGTYECPPPDWLVKGKFSREEYIQILQEHVKTVASHFKGRVSEWSIANEASSRSICSSGCDFWNDKIGPEYIEMSFRWAREADSNCTLIFNDDRNESPRDSQTQRIVSKMHATVKELKAKGVPIDVVGMQMHLLSPWASSIPPKKEDVIRTMQMFADLGVSIYITELDVNLQNISGSQQDRWEYEAKIYRDMMEACLESKVCKSFDTWGVSDSTSWYTCTTPGCLKLPNSDPLMFDKDFRPKPAYFAVRDVLLGK